MSNGKYWAHLTKQEKEDFEERAAVMQYDGKLSKDEAEQNAFADIISRRQK